MLSPQSFKLYFSYVGLNSIWNLLVYVVWGRDNIFFHSQLSQYLNSSFFLCRSVLPSLLRTKFPSIHESVSGTSSSVSPYTNKDPFITSKKAVFTDIWNDIILWVRCDYLQKGQCSKSMIMWHAYLAWIPSNLSIYREKVWQRKSEEDPENTGLLGEGEGDRLG